MIYEEMTNEVLECISACDGACPVCPAEKFCRQGDIMTRQKLATALLEEMDKPKVWDGAPEDAIEASVAFFKKGEHLNHVCKTYTRELPKTRIDEIADEVWHEINKGVTGLPIDIIKRGLKKYAEELEEK